MDAIYEYVLDTFGQQSDLQNLYTQISLIYSLPSVKELSLTDDEDTVVSTIRLRMINALRRLTESIPWISGQVVRTQNPEKSGNGNYKIVPLDTIPHFSIKDLRGSAEHRGLTMKAMRAANFPFSMLDENVIAPRNTLMAAGDVIPVFLVQATLLRSGEEVNEEEGNQGLVLTFVALHNVMDMTGFGWIIGLLDRVSKGGDLTPEEVQLANMDRRGVPKPIDLPCYPDLTTTNRDTVESRPGEGERDGNKVPREELTAPDAHWAYIAFPLTSLSEMKSHAVSLNQSQENQEKNGSPSFISTDDVLSAFIFQSIVRARLPRLRPEDRDPVNIPVTFARAIDPRRFLGMDISYPGVIQCMTYHKYAPQDITVMPLGLLAAELRAALRPSSSTTTTPSIATILSDLWSHGDIAYRTRLFATLISQSSGEPKASVTSSLHLTRDVMLSSWANQSALWTHDFGLGLGIETPESVRRPAFMGVESLCYIMPRNMTKGTQGDAVVAVCLRDEDMARMKQDEHVKKWGRWIG